jgi:5-methylcytosine-specific restriction endonuclease McrA
VSLSYHIRCKAFREYGRECLECGAEENIEVHHRDLNRWNNVVGNLAPLCEDCHNRTHSNDPEYDHWREQFDRRADPELKVSKKHIGKAFSKE